MSYNVLLRALGRDTTQPDVTPPRSAQVDSQVSEPQASDPAQAPETPRDAKTDGRQE